MHFERFTFPTGMALSSWNGSAALAAVFLLQPWPADRMARGRCPPLGFNRLSAVVKLLFFASSSSQPSANLIQRGLHLHITGD